MNELLNITAPTGLTMSSLEIAGLTGKRHLHVLRDIRKMLKELGVEETRFGSFYIGGQGKQERCFNLPRHETMVLVTGYSVALRSRVLARLDELEHLVANASPAAGSLVTDLSQEVRMAIGGITKGIVHKELTEIIPALVQAAFASQNLAFRSGKTAGQIWAQFGFPRIKVTSWFSNRLCEMSCQIDGGGRGELGGRTCKLFDPDKAERWIKNGGRQLVEAYIAERQGQTKLRLVA
jgi:phage regulator Rha-like protein